MAGKRQTATRLRQVADAPKPLWRRRGYGGQAATALTAKDAKNAENGRYIDAPVCRDEDKNSDGDCTDAATGIQGSNSGDEHLYYCQDGNYNTTSLVDSYDGAVVERYQYDPYGKVTVLHGGRGHRLAPVSDGRGG